MRPSNQPQLISIREPATLVARGLVLAAVAAVGVGCETKSFFDPGEVGRYERTPLVVPILDTLVVGIEQTDPVAVGARDVKPEDLIAPTEDITIRPNDLLLIEISDLIQPGAPKYEQKRVSESGRIKLPLIGELQVAGLTEAQASDLIDQMYRDADLIRNAKSSVVVSESVARSFTVVGFVNQQGTYQLRKSDLRLWEAITAAGGVSATEQVEYIYIVRRKDGVTPAIPVDMPAVPEAPVEPGFDPLMPQGRLSTIGPVFAMVQETDPLAPVDSPVMEDRVIQLEDAGTIPVDGGTMEPLEPVMSDDQPAGGPDVTTPAEPFEFVPLEQPSDREIIRVPFEPLMKFVDLRYNVVIKPGDMIYVPSPPIGEYYMDGHVLRGGAYSMTARKLTLQHALAAAGGMDEVAVPARTEIIRRVGPNQQVFVRVDLERIAAGMEPDVYIKPYDIIRVGTNAGAPFLASMRNAFRFTYGFGFLYDRNFAANENSNNSR